LETSRITYGNNGHPAPHAIVKRKLAKKNFFNGLGKTAINDLMLRIEISIYIFLLLLS
jgi:hypothetical protein